MPISGAPLLPPRKIPPVGEVPALLRLDGLYGAAILSQHDTSSIFRIAERESLAVPLDAAVGVDKLIFAHAQILRYRVYIAVCKAHIALPPAAGSAAEAGVNEGVCGRRLRHHALGISQGLCLGVVM